MCCVSVRMHCLQTDEGKKKKKKEDLLIGWGCACRGAGIWMDGLVGGGHGVRSSLSEGRGLMTSWSKCGATGTKNVGNLNI